MHARLAVLIDNRDNEHKEVGTFKLLSVGKDTATPLLPEWEAWPQFAESFRTYPCKGYYLRLIQPQQVIKGVISTAELFAILKELGKANPVTDYVLKRMEQLPLQLFTWEF